MTAQMYVQKEEIIVQRDNPSYPSFINPQSVPAQTYPMNAPPPERYPSFVVKSQETSLHVIPAEAYKPNLLWLVPLIFVSGGMNLSWGFGFQEIELNEHMKYSWFIGAIIGTAVTVIAVNWIQKKYIFVFAALVVVVSGILFVAASRNYHAILASRYLDGISNGLAFVPFFMLIGEEIRSPKRGFIASSLEMLGVSLGIFLQIIFAVIWYITGANSIFNLTQMLGLFSIVLGAVAFVVLFFFIVESPVFFLVREQELEATTSLRILKRSHLVQIELDEHLQYIAENKQMSFMQSVQVSLASALKLCIYRGMVALCYTGITGFTAILATESSWGIGAVWPLILFGGFRFVSSIVAYLTTIFAGVKKPMLLGALISGGMALGVGIIFYNPHNLLSFHQMSTAMILFFIFQFFVVLFIGSSGPYLSEAFPMAVKPYGIGLAYCIEMVVQIIICTVNVTDNYVIADYFIVVGSLMLGWGVLGSVFIPETKQNNLQEAQIKFHSVVTMAFD